jgi:methylthioribose-1-phosphate isomerase
MTYQYTFVIRLTTHPSRIPIEHRPAVEACLARGAVYPPSPNDPTPKQVVVMITPSNIDLDNGVYNPSFDVTPAELITAIVTEKGVAIKKEGAVDFDLSAVV